MARAPGIIFVIGRKVRKKIHRQFVNIQNTQRNTFNTLTKFCSLTQHHRRILLKLIEIFYFLRLSLSANEMKHQSFDNSYQL